MSRRRWSSAAPPAPSRRRRPSRDQPGNRSMRHDAHGYWIEEAGLEGTPSLPALAEDAEADVVIVGGGYTGLWSAWWVKRQEPDARVVLLEADHCGFGPSGRNGGFVNSMSFSLPTMRRYFSDRAAIEMVHAGDDSVRAIGAGARSRTSMPGSPTAATCRRRPRPTSTTPGSRSPPPARSSASRAGSRSSTATGTSERCDSPAVPCGRLLPGRRDGPAGPASPPACAQPGARAPGSRSTSTPGSTR